MCIRDRPRPSTEHRTQNTEHGDRCPGRKDGGVGAVCFQLSAIGHRESTEVGGKNPARMTTNRVLGSRFSVVGRVRPARRVGRNRRTGGEALLSTDCSSLPPMTDLETRVSELFSELKRTLAELIR